MNIVCFVCALCVHIQCILYSRRSVGNFFHCLLISLSIPERERMRESLTLSSISSSSSPLIFENVHHSIFIFIFVHYIYLYRMPFISFSAILPPSMSLSISRSLFHSFPLPSFLELSGSAGMFSIWFFSSSFLSLSSSVSVANTIQLYFIIIFCCCSSLSLFLSLRAFPMLSFHVSFFASKQTRIW